MPTGTTFVKHLRTLERRRDDLTPKVTEVPQVQAEFEALDYAIEVFCEIRELEDKININLVSMARVSLAFEFGIYQAESSNSGEPFFAEDGPEFQTVNEDHLTTLERRRDFLADRKKDRGSLSSFDQAEYSALVWACESLHQIEHVETRLGVNLLDLGYATEAYMSAMGKSENDDEE